MKSEINTSLKHIEVGEILTPQMYGAELINIYDARHSKFYWETKEGVFIDLLHLKAPLANHFCVVFIKYEDGIRQKDNVTFVKVIEKHQSYSRAYISAKNLAEELGAV
jgi:hypothetical protein